MDRTLDTRKSSASTVLPAGAAAPDDESPHLVTGAASSGLRGWRISMEDAVVHELLSEHLGVFAVLDGHGGPFCSKWGADELPRRLRHLASRIDSADDGEEASYVAQQLSEVVRQMDADLRNCGRPAWACGTTLVSLLVSRRSLTVANLGDSRAVLCRSGVPLPLSRDHKPRMSAERERILHAGGFIVDGRVNGDLSLSRALGDFRHKCVANLPPSKQPVSAEPEVRSTKRLRSDHFVLLACDGVWDVMSSADAISFIASHLERVPPPSTADRAEGNQYDAATLRVAFAVVCEMLLDEAIARGSTDNVSAPQSQVRKQPQPQQGPTSTAPTQALLKQVSAAQTHDAANGRGRGGMGRRHARRGKGPGPPAADA